MQPCSSYGDTNYAAVFLSCTLVSYYSVLHHSELIMAKEFCSILVKDIALYNRVQCLVMTS